MPRRTPAAYCFVHARSPKPVYALCRENRESTNIAEKQCTQGNATRVAQMKNQSKSRKARRDVVSRTGSV